MYKTRLFYQKGNGIECYFFSTKHVQIVIYINSLILCGLIFVFFKIICFLHLYGVSHPPYKLCTNLHSDIRFLFPLGHFRKIPILFVHSFNLNGCRKFTDILQVLTRMISTALLIPTGSALIISSVCCMTVKCVRLSVIPRCTPCASSAGINAQELKDHSISPKVPYFINHTYPCINGLPSCIHSPF